MPEVCDVRSVGDVWHWVRGRVVAVSLTILYGNPAVTPTMPHAIEFFRGQQPVGRTRGFLVYDFRP
jgi:hypothetical protein